MVATPHLLTVSEAAQALRVSRTTIYEKIRCGELRAWHIGESRNSPLRIPEHELQHVLRDPRSRPSIDVDAELAGLRDQLRRAAS